MNLATIGRSFKGYLTIILAFEHDEPPVIFRIYPESAWTIEIELHRKILPPQPLHLLE
jgi:hypothetical protein